MSPFDHPSADIVEVQQGDELDVVAVMGRYRALAFVSVANGEAVRLRLRSSRQWRCDEHGLQSRPLCRHAEDVIHALAHLKREDRQRKHPTPGVGVGESPLTRLVRTRGEGSRPREGFRHSERGGAL